MAKRLLCWGLPIIVLLIGGTVVVRQGPRPSLPSVTPARPAQAEGEAPSVPVTDSVPPGATPARPTQAAATPSATASSQIAQPASTACSPTPALPPPTSALTSPFQVDGPTAWCWQEALGLVNALNDVFFWDARTGWAVGERGTILHTDDGGASWRRQVSLVPADLHRVTFVDEKTGWALGVLGNESPRTYLLHTGDGGQNWNDISLILDSGAWPADMTWPNASVGWLSVGEYVFHTSDGGQSWQKLTLPIPGGYPDLSGIISADDQHVWAYAPQVILRTSDGGETWKRHTFGGGSTVSDMVFVDAQTGWGIGLGLGLIQSTDGGATWRVRDDRIAGDAIAFANAQIGWVVDRDRLWRTTDGGLTWEVQQVPEGRRAADFVDARLGWVVGTLGGHGQRMTIVHTGDGGASWHIQDQYIETPALAFTATAHLNALLAQPDPPTAVLRSLLQAPCQSQEEREWMTSAFESLGWDGAGWSRPVTPANDLAAAIHRLEIDLDEDRQDEIVLYSDVGGALLGVLDWDGRQWQAAWQAYQAWQSERVIETPVRVDDWNADGHPEILVETSQDGYVDCSNHAELLRCEHLQCHSIWSDVAGYVGSELLGSKLLHRWESSEYQWVDWDGDASLEIQAQHYGLVHSVTTDRGRDIPGTLEARVLTTTQIVYRWDGAQYTPTAETVLEAGHALDTRPFTQTLDLDGDGAVEQVTSHWEAGYYGGLQQILTVYTRSEREEWQPLQAFRAMVMYPPAGVSLQNADGDSSLEATVCTNPVFTAFTLDTWPSREPPLCTTYDWDSTQRLFVARAGPTISPFSPFQVNSTEGWCWQEMLDLVHSLDDVFFLSTHTGWAVGEEGTILHTDDGGDTWQRQASPVAADLARVVFTSANNGWILGVDERSRRNVLLHTRDGGLSWEEHPAPSPQDGAYSYQADMTWADARSAWITTERRVFHTADGGQSWQEQSLPLEKNDWARSITCVDDRHAWIAAGGHVLRTTDGGQTWTSHTIGRTPDNSYLAIGSLSFLDAYTGLATGTNSPVMRTVDGGQTWQIQYEVLPKGWPQTILFSREPAGCWLGKVCIGPEKRTPTLDGEPAWLVTGEGGLWQTTDGGANWVKRQGIPSSDPAVTFVDAQNGWAVGGGWRWEDKRTTIVHTDDGGQTWHVQDAHVEMPPLAYTSTARLSAYLARREPPLDALLLLLLSGPCGYMTYDWVATALHNLGWTGDRWISPPIFKSELAAIQRLDLDLDGDGSQEIVLYGGSEELFVGVLDWDGGHWQVAWSDFAGSRYEGDIQIRADDLEADGRPELVIEMLRHPGSGTGYLSTSYDMSIIQCRHLYCYPIWEQVLGDIERSGGIGLRYEGSGSSLRFAERRQSRYPEIELEQYGVKFDVPWSARSPSGLAFLNDAWTAYVLTGTRVVYHWDGERYAPADPVQIQPGYMLDTRPVTESADLDGDGKLERAIYGWKADGDGLWQTLSIYGRDERDDWQLTRVFTAAFTGMPSAGVSLQDVDGDGRSEVVQCTTSFTLQVPMRGDEWPSVQPVCTVYQWNPATREFELEPIPISHWARPNGSNWVSSTSI